MLTPSTPYRCPSADFTFRIIVLILPSEGGGGGGALRSFSQMSEAKSTFLEVVSQIFWQEAWYLTKHGT